MRATGSVIVVMLVLLGCGGSSRSPLDKEVLRLTTQPADHGLCLELAAIRRGTVEGDWTDDQRRLIVDVASNRYALDC
jgi:hypothetical protein